MIIDPGQRASRPLQQILDRHRLTPAAVLLTHGHLDHMWSAQKVADTYGCPVYIHPDDRAMLTDPIMDLGVAGKAQSLLLGVGKRAVAAFFTEPPRQVVELTGDGELLDLGGIPVTVDHTPGGAHPGIGRLPCRRPRAQRRGGSARPVPSPVTLCSKVRSAVATCSAAADVNCSPRS